MARRPLEAFGLYLSSKNTDDVLQELAPTPYMTDGRVSFISLRKREVLQTTETCNKCLLSVDLGKCDPIGLEVIRPTIVGCLFKF